MTESIRAIAVSLGVGLDERQLAALADFVQLLSRWNATYNLTAVRDVSDILALHIADCLATVPGLLRLPSRRRLLDVGSGGGLPGVIIAVALPDCDVTCVDAVGKKAAFIRQVAGTLRLVNLRSVHARVEALEERGFDIVVSRAFASLTELVALSGRLVAKGGVWMAMKGQRPDGEISELPPSVEVFHVEQLSIPGLKAERCSVWMRHRAAASGGSPI